MDDDAGGEGWYFDTTPFDDAEFTALASPFQASFIDATSSGQEGANDFYRTISHEIGHTLGIGFGVAELAIFQFLSDAGTDQNTSGGSLALKAFHNPSGQFGNTVTLTENGGGHIYEGPADPSFPNAPTHPHDLMNPGRTVPAGQPNPPPPIETTRQFISDLDAQLLADAYGYTVTLPSQLDTAHATLDSLTGTLLVQGLPGTVDETISINTVGNDLEVVVDSTKELFLSVDVKKIVIAGNGGTDSITVDLSVTQPWQKVDYVVSSNEDLVESGTLGDGVIDLDSIVPGNQVTVRAAVQEANAAGSGSIYVPRGNYALTIAGSNGDAVGDLNITGDVTVVGSGPGATILEVDAALLMTRHFQVMSSGTLDLQRLTLTGGSSPNGAAIDVGQNFNPGGTALTLEEVAIVDNGGMGAGGALFVGQGSTVEITRSVLANDSAFWAGGGIFVDGGSSGVGNVLLSETIVANNSANMYPDDPDLAAGGSGSTRGTITTLGNNLIGKVDSAIFTPLASDYISPTGSADYVVTTIEDELDDLNDLRSFSIREAVIASNGDIDTAEEIWLPAWDFVLTRDRATFGNGSMTDTEAAFGDLDIKDDLILRSAGSATSVTWKMGVDPKEKIFELLGDSSSTGAVTGVGGEDYIKWQQENGSGVLGEFEQYDADGNDDGVVDAADLALWQQYNGKTLELINFS